MSNKCPDKSRLNSVFNGRCEFSVSENISGMDTCRFKDTNFGSYCIFSDTNRIPSLLSAALRVVNIALLRISHEFMILKVQHDLLILLILPSGFERM